MGAAASVLFFPCTAAFTGFKFFKCCCTGSMGGDGLKPWQAKLYYVLFLALGTLLGFLFGRIGENDNGGFLAGILCQGDICDGFPAVLRASLASVVFFGLMLLGTAPVPTFKGDDSWKPLLGEGFHRGWWGIKIFVYFGLVIGFMFIENLDEDAYVNVARVVSIIFLIAQILVLLDFAYIWDETWLDRSDIDNDFADGSKFWLWALVGLSVLTYLVAFGGIIALLVLYNGCRDSIGITSFSFALIIVCIAVTLLKGYIVEDAVGGSIAPPAVVSGYIAYMTFSAIQSNPNVFGDCDPFNTGGENGLEIFLSIVISTISLIWMALTVSGNSTSLLGGGGSDDRAVADVGGAYEIEEADGTTRYANEDKPAGDADEEAFQDDKLWWFHLIMVTASFYMLMVLTNWGVNVNSVDENNEQVVEVNSDEGKLSMYIKATVAWLTGFLYIWTIVAPAVLPDRDW